MMSTPHHSLAQARDRVGRLLDVLDDEYRLLGHGAIKELETLQSSKRELIEDLANDGELVELQARHRQTESWSEFLGLVRKCRYRNLVNGAAMQEMLRLRRSALEVLMGRSSDEGQYLANGRLTSSGQQRSLGQA